MKKMMKNFSSLILSMMLIVAMALCATGCGGKETGVNSESQMGGDTQADKTVLGEGAEVFTFTVVDADGNETVFEIHTDEEMVGDALLEHNLIEGDEGAYGLYVKTVNGITADFDVDGSYWAFYINGEYGMTGVDATPVVDGDSYAFKVEK